MLNESTPSAQSLGARHRLLECLDVQFADDYARTCTEHAAHKLATVQRIALNLLRRSPRKARVKAKRLLACVFDTFRSSLPGIGRMRKGTQRSLLRSEPEPPQNAKPVVLRALLSEASALLRLCFH
jgi:hypothetical protein